MAGYSLKNNFLFIIIIITVYLSFSEAQQKLHVPDEFNTVAEAIDRAAPGDTIFIDEGTYREQLIITKDLTLMGAGISKTILRESPECPDSTILFINGASVKLQDIQFWGGGDSEGGRRGVIAVNALTSIQQCVFVQCYNVSLACINGRLDIDTVLITCQPGGDNIIVDSSRSQGWGVSSDIGILIVNSIFSINHFTGGAAVDHLIDVRPDLNSNPNFLGANYPSDTSQYSNGTIMNSTFYGSRLSYWGQGIRIFGSLNKHRPELEIKNNVFKGQVEDSADAFPSMYSTAGISFNGANGFAEIYGNRISNFNSGISFYGMATADVHDNVIENNGRYGVVTSWAGSWSLQPDLGKGEFDSPGRNTITNNGIFNIYNLNSKPLFAINNIWSSYDPVVVDSLIFDNEENPLSGEVIFLPVLPVELTSLTAQVVNNKVELRWSTATETNNSGFGIERCRKPEAVNTWFNIGFVSGEGTTSIGNNYFFVDESPGEGIYLYRLKQTDYSGSYKYYSFPEVEIRGVQRFHLKQNYPNPFNSESTLEFHVADHVMVSLKLYDILGNELQTLVNEEKDAGEYHIKFNASNLPSGIYYYSLQAGTFVDTKKLILIK